MVSPDKSAGAEEEILDVPEHAKKLRLRWEKGGAIPPETTPPPATAPPIERFVPLPAKIREFMKEIGLDDRSSVGEEQIPELCEHFSRLLKTETYTLWQLQQEKANYGPEVPHILSNRLRAQQEKVKKLEELKFGLDGWKPEHYGE